jgi:hypothetical protein
MHPVLLGAFQGAGWAVTIPRLVRANVVQILMIVESMLRALRTGRMRWSLQKRAHFGQAGRLAFLIEKGRAPEEGESFEALFRARFPHAPAGARHRRRRR